MTSGPEVIDFIKVEVEGDLDEIHVKVEELEPKEEDNMEVCDPDWEPPAELPPPTSKKSPKKAKRRKQDMKSKRVEDEDDSWNPDVDGSNLELEADCKRILLEKRDKWHHKVQWEEGPDGRLQMSREEMLKLKDSYKSFLRRKTRETKMAEEGFIPAKSGGREGLEEECRRILLEKRDKWGQNVQWEVGKDGRLLMSVPEMKKLRESYLRRLRRNRAEEAKMPEGDGSGSTRAQLELECRKILIEKRDKWHHKVSWEVGADGKLLMSIREMCRLKTAYKTFVRRKKREAAGKKTPRKPTSMLTEDERWRRRMENYLRKQARKASMSKEELEKLRQCQKDKQKFYYYNMMTPEQRKRYSKSKAQGEAMKRYAQKNKDKLRQKLEAKRLNETPEQRRETLRYYRIQQAKKLRKKKLLAAGTSPEEIRRQLEELVLKMKNEPLLPLEQLSSYKPKPRKNLKVHEGVAEAVATTTGQSEVPSSSGPVDAIGNQVHFCDIVYEAVPAEGCNDCQYEEMTPLSPPSPPSPSLIPEYISPVISVVSQQCHHLLPQAPALNDLTPAFPSSSVSVLTSSSVSSNLTISDSQQHGEVPRATSHTAKVPQLKVPLPQPVPVERNKCPHCASSFSQLLQLQSHISTSHPEKNWKCPRCSAVVLSPQDLSEHFKSHHSKRPANEEERNVKTKPREPEPPHKSNEKQPKSKRKAASGPVKTFPFVCLKCPVRSSKSQYETLKRLSDHVQISHPKSYWPCSKCKLLKYTQSSLKLHSSICRKS